MDKKQSALFSAIAYSYICFIDDYLAVLKNPAYNSTSYMDEDISSILSEMKTLFLSTPSLLSGETDMKEAYAKKLVDFRVILEDKYRCLHSLQRELQHITTFFNLKNAVATATYEDFGMTEQDATEMDFSMLAKDCTKFVFSSSDQKERQQRASHLLSFVPMRMTKESFMNYVEKSLARIHIDDTVENANLLSSILLQQFDGKLYKGYDKHFPDLRLSLSELAGIEDLEDFYDEAELTNETLDYTVNLVTKLYHMICTFSNLLIFDVLTFEALTDMHVSFYDLYCSIQNILDSHEDAEILLETLPERIDTIKEQLEKAYIKEGRRGDTDPVFQLMQAYITMSIHQVFGFDTAKHDPYSTEVTSILRDLVAEIRERLESLSPAERKLRMQYFMSVIPFMMKDNTFYEYIMHGFSNVQNPLRNLYTAMFLSNILEQGGFFEATDSSTSHHHTVLDNHSEDMDAAAHFLAAHTPHDTCGCGHHHDDDQECCGGHHHDPNHSCNCGHHHH